MSESHPPKIDTIASLDPAHRSLLQTGVDRVAAHIHLDPGSHMAVVYEGKLYLGAVSENVRTAAADIVLCPTDFCKQIQPELNAYCRANERPAGTPVPCVFNGKLCYCVCCA